jgi:D-alanine-D-alanine ligase
VRIALADNLKRSASEEEAELDTADTIDAVRAIIASLGHTVIDVEVSVSIPALVQQLVAAAPDLVFNLAEGLIGTARAAFFPALFEQLKLPYTGSDAGVQALTADKATTNKLLSRLPGVSTPRSVMVRDVHAVGRLPEGMDRLAYPLFVKPNYEGSSKGITQRSVVEDGEQLTRVARELLGRYPAGLIIEEFIDGLDVATSWVDGLGILAPAVYRYRPTGKYRIYEIALKRTGLDLVEAEVPAALDESVLAQLRDVSTRVFPELGVTGYGRADFRVTPQGGVYFLEMNPLPSLAPGSDSELYKAAALLGLRPADVFARIIDAAARRFGLGPSYRHSASHSMLDFANV